MTTTSVPTDLRVNTTALNAVALSSVAKYWVLTNLLPGPIPQVSVYGIPGSRPDNPGKVGQVSVRRFAEIYDDNIGKVVCRNF